MGSWGWRLGSVLASVVLRGGAGPGVCRLVLPARLCPIPAGRSGGSTSFACPQLPGGALCQRNPRGLGPRRLPVSGAARSTGRRLGRGPHATGGSSAGWPGTVATASVVSHVLHAHTAPHAQHEALDVTLVGSTHDAEVALLSPVWAPRVGRGLGMRRRMSRAWRGGGRGKGTAAAAPAAQGLTQYLSVLPSGSDSSPHLRARPGRSKRADSTCFQGLHPRHSLFRPLLPWVTWVCP